MWDVMVRPLIANRAQTITSRKRGSKLVKYVGATRKEGLGCSWVRRLLWNMEAGRHGDTMGRGWPRSEAGEGSRRHGAPRKGRRRAAVV